MLVGGKADETHKTSPYNDLEYEFGRENLALKGVAFQARCKKLIKNIEKYLKVPTLGEESKAELENRKIRLQEALK